MRSKTILARIIHERFRHNEKETGYRSFIFAFPQNHEGHSVLSSTPILAAKSVTLWARLLPPLAALSGLEVHEYVVTPDGLPGLEARFVNNPR